ncbi:hypothetical protein BDV30DRAFT_204579 [Aspergillus minisclerotigenes]|uniref:Uncharacterized protein n=1 Tax=Aspergillus minisclerotigenes TaxID=656917 RepID=A0A5N6JGG0_9EURO|nr:hypothetical protein BDV30DRAFT_204579 [Aspergillus minisclerotigenes]
MPGNGGCLSSCVFVWYWKAWCGLLGLPPRASCEAYLEQVWKLLDPPQCSMLQVVGSWTRPLLKAKDPRGSIADKV